MKIFDTVYMDDCRLIGQGESSFLNGNPYNSALATDYWSAAAITDDSGTILEYEP